MINDWLDILPKWLGFALQFPVNPRGALGPYTATGIVSKDLTLLAVAGIAVSYLLIIVTAPPSLTDDRSRLVQFFRRIDLKLLPPILILMLVAFSVGLHLLAKLYLALPRADDLTANWATIEDTVNATLGFASLYIPFATLLFSLMVRLPRSGKAPNTLFVLGTLLNTVSFITYLPLSLATFHRTTFWPAFFILCVAMGIAVAVVFVTAKWVRNA